MARTSPRCTVELPKIWPQYRVCVARNSVAYLHRVRTGPRCAAHALRQGWPHPNRTRTVGCFSNGSPTTASGGRYHLHPPSAVAQSRPHVQIKQNMLRFGGLSVFAHAAFSAISRCRWARTLACRCSRSLLWNCRSLHTEKRCDNGVRGMSSPPYYRPSTDRCCRVMAPGQGARCHTA
jgi:hypothetical protein